LDISHIRQAVPAGSAIQNALLAQASIAVLPAPINIISYPSMIILMHSALLNVPLDFGQIQQFAKAATETARAAMDPRNTSA
jgi:hypothetical protein